MNDSLTSFSVQLGHPELRIRTVDIAANCSRKEKILARKDLKLGRKEEKVSLPCYECDK